MVIGTVDELSIKLDHIPTIRGSILFTFRDRRILDGHYYGFPYNYGVEVSSMSSSEAMDMCKKLGLHVSTISQLGEDVA